MIVYTYGVNKEGISLDKIFVAFYINHFLLYFYVAYFLAKFII